MEYEFRFLWYESRDYRIYKAVHKQDRFMDVLIKEYKEHVSVDRIHFEKEILTSLRGNRKFIQLLDIFTSARAYNLVLENCHFTLQQYSDNTLFKDKTIADITWELFESVRQLNNNNVYLLNLRPENVWVQLDPRDNSCTFKITDFLDCVRDWQPMQRQLCYPDYFAAPETYDDKSNEPLTKADIYSLGKIMLTLRTKEPSVANKFDRKNEAQIEADKASLHECLNAIVERAEDKMCSRRANLFQVYMLFKEYYSSELR